MHPWSRNAFNMLIRCAPLAVCRRALARAVCMSAMMRLSPRNPPAIIHSFVYQSDKERRERHAGGRVDTRLYVNYEGIQIFGENWNNGLKSAWLPGLTVTRGIRFMFHNRPRCSGWEKKSHTQGCGFNEKTIESYLAFKTGRKQKHLCELDETIPLCLRPRETLRFVGFENTSTPSVSLRSCNGCSFKY